MNIFFLDETPELSAKMLCDKHVPKMLLESAQMLSTAVRKYEKETDTNPLAEPIYKSAYPNHPMTIWVSETLGNFTWALYNAFCINNEYEYRFKKNHKSYKVIKNIIDFELMANIPDGDFTDPPQCITDQYKLRSDLYVNAYRDYYKGEKEYFAKWEKGRQQPEWW